MEFTDEKDACSMPTRCALSLCGAYRRTIPFLSFLKEPEAEIGTIFAFPTLLLLVDTPPQNRGFIKRVLLFKGFFKDVRQISNANIKPL
jgi:hypothetical protein